MKQLKLKLFFVLATLWMAGSIGAWATVGSTFTATNMNGVAITYKVLTEDGSTGTVQVGDDYNQAVPTIMVDGETVFDIPVGTFVIPTTVSNAGITYTVTAIGNDAFEYYGKTLTDITIPATVTEIGNWAFYASGIESVQLPDALISIGNNAFNDCDALTAIDIPQSVSTLGEYCFANCDQIGSVTLHAGNLAEIGKGVFTGSGITSIAIPAGVTSIGYSAFSDCSSLQTVILPEGLISIGDNAFGGCQSLSAIDIPSSVSQLGSSVFEQCTQLATVTLHEGNLTEISQSMFSKSGITSISIPEGVTVIRKNAFMDCPSLETAFIPSTVTSIELYAFYQCNVLREVTMACDETPSLPYRSDWVFSNAEGKVDVLKTPWESNIENYFKSLFKSSVEVPLVGGRITVDDHCYRILSLDGDGLGGTVQLGAGFSYPGYDGQSSGEVTIDEEISLTKGSDTYTFSVTTLGEAAFAYAYDLGSITIPASITLIKKEAVYDCKNLERVYVKAETPCTLEEDAFRMIVDEEAPCAIPTNCMLVVPAGRKTAYQNSSWGSVFTKIKEVGKEVDWPTMAESQVNQNPYNKCKALTSKARWKPNRTLYMENNMWNMPYMMDGKFYVSAFWQSNNSSIQSEWFYDDNPNFLQLCYNPPVLSPNYGVEYSNGGTSGMVHDEQPGITLGGFICFKVKGSGKIVVRGYTESKNAYMAICVEGNDFKAFSGGDKNSETTYTYTLPSADTEAYAYVYGASLSPYGRHGYIKSITFYPDGVAEDDDVKLAIAGTPVAEGTDYSQGGVSVTWEEADDNYYEPEDEDNPDGESEDAGLWPIITLNNVNLTCATGPAIEVNSYNEVTIRLVGDNTVSTTKDGCAAISIGTTDGGGDWNGCSLVTIGPEMVEGKNYTLVPKGKGTLTIPASSSIGLYSNASSVRFMYTTADISGTDYGILACGGSIYGAVSNEQTDLKLHGNTSAYLYEGGGWQGSIYGDLVESAPVDDDMEYKYDDYTGQYDFVIYNEEDGSGDCTVANYLWFAPVGDWVEAPLGWSTKPVSDWNTYISIANLDFTTVSNELLCYMVLDFDATNLTLTLKRVNGSLYSDDRYAVLLYNQTADKTLFHIPYSNNAPEYGHSEENKLLKGYDGVPPTDGDYTNFVLTMKDDNYLFRPLGSTRDLTGKGYLPVPTADLPADADARGFRILFDGDAPTGIANVEQLRVPAQVVFDLLGRQQQHYRRGISVRNGKKVLMK